MPLLDRFYGWLATEGLNLLKIFVVAALLVRLVRWTSRRMFEWAKRQPLTAQREQQILTMTSVVNGVGAVTIGALSSMMALKEIGLDVRPLLAGAGIVGLAAGFGAQNMVRDLIQGVFILVENQYGIGDLIRVAGIQGTVELMTLRRTVVRDGEGAIHYVPNGEIRIVANLSRDWSQVSLSVPVGARKNLEQVLDLLRAAGRELAEDPATGPCLLETPRLLGLDKFTTQEMEILMQVRTQPGRREEVSRELRRRIKMGFERAGLSPADPLEVHSR